jgi:hypothetical protein
MKAASIYTSADKRIDDGPAKLASAHLMMLLTQIDGKPVRKAFSASAGGLSVP